jgi:hypothetical protein
MPEWWGRIIDNPALPRYNNNHLSARHPVHFQNRVEHIFLKGLRSMARTSGFIVAFCLALHVLSIPLHAQSSTEQRVTVKSVIGSAELRSSGAAKWRQLRPGMPVRIGGDIRTFVESTVELAFESGTVLLISENSVVTLSQLSQDVKGNPANSSVKVATGQIFSNVKKLVGTNSKFEFETPTAVASIRGTRLGISVNRDGSSIDVYEGRVAVRSRGSNREVMVGNRTRAVVRSGSREIGVQSFEDLKKSEPAAAPIVDPFTADSTPIASVPGVTPGSDSTAVNDSTTRADSTLQRDSTGQGGASVPTDSTIVPGHSGLPADSADSHASSPAGDSATGATAPLASGPLTLTITAPAPNAVVKEPRVSIAGKTVPAALVTIGGSQVSAGSDGVFAATIDLSPGPNAITVVAQLAGSSQRAVVNVACHPPLSLKVGNLSDNMTVSGADLPVDVEVSEGARYTIKINNRESSSPVRLTPGANTILVTATDQWNNQASRSFVVLYQPKKALFLNLSSPPDRARLPGPSVVVTGTTLPGARVSVNGAAAPVDAGGAFKLSLTLSGEGSEFPIAVVAESDGQEVTREISVLYEKKLSLQLTKPQSGQTVDKPLIMVGGIVTPGSQVFVDNAPVVLDAAGGFSYQLNIPDEPGEYSFEVRAQLGGQEVSQERSVQYVRPRLPLALKVQTPIAGQRIQLSPLRVSGAAAGASQVLVNSVRASLSPTGQFSADLILTERDVGDFTIDITASNDEEELSRSIDVTVDPLSPQINTSVPVLFVKEASLKATRTGELTAQATDATPGDQLTLVFEHNGAIEQFTLDPNAQERLKLDEGRNTYRIKVKDLAGNLSNVVSNEIFYLPGPLQIEINTPDHTPMTIDDLPPMPRGIGTIETDIEVEIDDGIGTIPQTIRFCKISGQGQDLQLYNNAQYIFRGKVKLVRGRNDFLIVVEDIAGNRQTKPLSITISE